MFSKKHKNCVYKAPIAIINFIPAVSIKFKVFNFEMSLFYTTHEYRIRMKYYILVTICSL